MNDIYINFKKNKITNWLGYVAKYTPIVPFIIMTDVTLGNCLPPNKDDTYGVIICTTLINIMNNMLINLVLDTIIFCTIKRHFNTNVHLTDQLFLSLVCSIVIITSSLSFFFGFFAEHKI